jgi:small subunit ribosomal protein S5
MDFVDRFEKRTLWGAGKELSAKWGSTIVIMRGRPAGMSSSFPSQLPHARPVTCNLANSRSPFSTGFGLAVPPGLHRLFTACGIRDASATIEGSRNPMNVMKAALQILHGGSALPGFGDGIGKKGARGNKGVGMRSREEVERERGRWGIEVGRKL